MNFVSTVAAILAVKPAKTYTVIYRTGGTDNCSWWKTAPTPSAREAWQRKDAIERGGRKALIMDTATLEAVGMPEGWDPETWTADQQEAASY